MAFAAFLVVFVIGSTVGAIALGFGIAAARHRKPGVSLLRALDLRNPSKFDDTGLRLRRTAMIWLFVGWSLAPLLFVTAAIAKLRDEFPKH
jgi:hypothetical protein